MNQFPGIPFSNFGPAPGGHSLAGEYFDSAGLLRQEHFERFHLVIEAFRQADLDAVIYSDVLEYLDRENEPAEGLDLERKLLAKLRRGGALLNGILKTKLLPYQERGAIFAACRGRVVLADDMGLGKTVQAREKREPEASPWRFAPAVAPTSLSGRSSKPGSAASTVEVF